MANSHTKLREGLIRDLTAIANGAFLPRGRTQNTFHPTHISSYVYDREHPMHSDTSVLCFALQRLLAQNGLSPVREHPNNFQNLNNEVGIRLLRNEFLALYYETKGPRRRIDIVTSTPETLDAVFKSTHEKIIRAADVTLNLAKLSS